MEFWSIADEGVAVLIRRVLAFEPLFFMKWPVIWPGRL